MSDGGGIENDGLNAEASEKPKSRTRTKKIGKPKASTKAAPGDGRPRIVAIGASAGGLEPIEQFFHAIPGKTGLAYVIVQHLSPDFRSMMPELLSRHSQLKIVRAEDGMRIEPDTIYLNPPRASLELRNGTIMLHVEADPREYNLPINSFLESLAADRGADAICVIMSGTGSDGTLGARAIAEAGGAVFAQDPQGAKFESMPRSVIESISTCVYAAPMEIPALISRVVKGEDVVKHTEPLHLDYDDPERSILRLLQVRFGLDFGYYKTSTVGRRVRRRAQLAKYEDLKEYLFALSRSAEELEALYTDLLIGVTAFFRDKAAFDLLAARCIPDLISKMSKNKEVRIWVPGCASGEEAYSLAMLLAERARIVGAPLEVKIFATDLHPRSLKVASRGVYSAAVLNAVPSELRARYFEANGDEFQVSKALREKVIFSKHNLIKDPPFTRMDLVSCRNLLIYLDDEAQRKSLAMFHFALVQGGVMFLGPSESLNDLGSEFETIDPRWRIFTKKRNVRLLEATRLLPLSSGATATGHETRPVAISTAAFAPPVSTAAIQQRHALLRIYDAVLSRFVGTSILVGRSGEIMHVFGDAGRFLSFRQGSFSTKVVDLIDPQLRQSISAGLDRLSKSSETEYTRTAQFRPGHEGPPKSLIISLAVVPTIDSETETPLILTIQEAAAQAIPLEAIDDPLTTAGDDSKFLQLRIDELERDLRFSEQTLHTTIEELETANEELQATNEELQATNEELMAANEELQTVNEELHAVNEELFTVSAEHQSKIDELTSTTNDLDNLLESTNIGVIFLDRELHIRRVTPAVSDTFNILPRDIGRPISHVTSRFEYPDIGEAITSVLSSGRAIEKAIQSAGQDFLLRMLPYNRGNYVDGVVMTIFNITDIARANRSLSQFADIVSHDLRAPLRAIRNSSEWIVEDLRDNADTDIQGHVDMLISHTDRLERMLNDLRDFSNLKLKHDVLEPVDLNAMIREICSFYSQDQLNLVAQSPLPVINTARAPLRLVLQNLVDNAVKHADKTPVTVMFSARAESAVLISIQDDGPGIDPRHHDKIFLPFRKLRAEASPGSGIGLALVKKTVEDQGGMIEVHSPLDGGRGAMFRFTWPDRP